MRLRFLILLINCCLFAGAITREEAKEFLFSTLSLPDREDYSEEFYLENIDITLKAKEEMPWGKIVPEREFLHFVLPVRVNNENLDNSRQVFYEELKERVKGMTMEEAILEVNHWCHEHVTYQPSDSRTSSPLSSISQAIGRCGEESTFTVAALRSIGIPARQIYTPRWAHTDDNHAWVEAWANGKWYFLGACEPEPVLNLAWFNAPASRGLLMTTNVAGDYNGPEEILWKEPLTTRINVTENYAPIDTLYVRTVDAAGNPLPGVKVNFCIYNYAEFYPAVSKRSDCDGIASITSGLGDLVIWASDGENFGFSKGRPGDMIGSKNNPLYIVLDKNNSFVGTFELDIIPPVPGNNPVTVTDEMKNENDRRKALEDKIRNSYISTFFKPEDTETLASELGLYVSKLKKVLTESRGNHQAITQLLKNTEPENRPLILHLLSAVTEKDRRDIEVSAIKDHVDNAIPFSEFTGYFTSTNIPEREIYDNYILNPRIDTEFIREWRSSLISGFSKDTLTIFRNNPEKITEWISRSIGLIENENPQNLKLSPLGVWKGRKADKTGRNIFYVALARSAGLPSRIDPVTGKLQYLNKEAEWIDVTFGEDNKEEPELTTKKGFLNLTFTPEGFLQDPKYYSNFSLSKIDDGVPHLLEYDDEAIFSQLFAEPVLFEAGQYILTTGQRLADGAVLARSVIFEIKPDETVTIPLTIRTASNKISVIGSLNAENIYHDLEEKTDKSILSTTGRGYYVAGILKPNHEPSEHLLNDMSAVKETLENDGRKIVLLFDNNEEADRFNMERFPNLPSNIIFGIDSAGSSKKDITESLNIENPDYPLIVIADSFNRIVWVSEGYNIGTGEKIAAVLSQLE